MFRQLPNFKTAMARVSAQAMVLTAPSTGSSISSYHGMTLSSVCSLSVHPEPLLQFNLHLPSYTSQALHENQYLAIHLLPPTPAAVRLGRIFASGVKTDPKHFDVKSDDGSLFHEMTTPFKDLSADEYALHPIGKVHLPILKELEVAFVCKKSQVVLVGNHEIWVVGVESILQPNDKYAKEKSGGLLYYERGFHKIGRALEERDRK